MVLFLLYLLGPFLRNPGRRRRSQDKLEPRLYLEELHPNAGEHELKQRGDDHDVPDGPDGDEHALNHVLQWESRWEGDVGSGNACRMSFLCLSTSLPEEAAWAALHHSGHLRLQEEKHLPKPHGDERSGTQRPPLGSR